MQNGCWLAFASLILACNSAIAEPTPKSGDPVLQAEPGDFCDAFAVIREKCVRCHGSPPSHGAPFSLDSYDATQVPSHDGKTIRADRMGQVIASGFMPLTSLRLDPPVEPLSCEEKATILEWVGRGAPPPPEDDPGCDEARPSLRECAPES
ncbi:MAG TPA: hypothetical protein VFV94_12205 [Polyangiaceae bacterium]|jgi:hypothetical protein|nr:hypothetical protein [Polyangiaceae bacterium]